MLFSLAIMSSSATISQSFYLGTPEVINHNKETYQAAAQIWDINIDENHIYFATHGGVLTYDGLNWRQFYTEDQTIMRSLSLDDQETLFIGAQNEIGYFKPNQNGLLSYTSLKDKINERYQDLSEIWDIVNLNDQLYFSSDNRVYELENDSFNVYIQESPLRHMAKVGNQIWFQTTENGIMIIENGEISHLEGSNMMNPYEIASIQKSNSGIVYCFTKRDGIFMVNNGNISKWPSNAIAYLEQHRINTAIYKDRYGFIIGTATGGVIGITESGLCYFKIDKSTGLQNDNIISLALAQNDNLWVGSNNGIDEVNLASAKQKFYPDNELQGAVYDMEKWNGNIYFATSNGLYYIKDQDYYHPFQGRDFKFIEGTSGQIWGTDIINDRFYIAHQDGAKVLNKNNIVTDIFTGDGVWKFVKLDEETIAIGGYRGIDIYKYSSNNSILEYHTSVSDFFESARIMNLDRHGYLWVSHPYKDVYRFKFDADFSNSNMKVFTANEGLKVNNRNYAIGIDSTCYVTNETGIYKFYPELDSFKLAPEFEELFSIDNPARRIIPMESEIWAITDKYTSKIEVNKLGLENQYNKVDYYDLDLESNYIGGFESLFRLDDESIIIASEVGAIEYNLTKNQGNIGSVKVHSINFTLQKDSLGYAGFGEYEALTIKPKENALRFEFGIQPVNNGEIMEYSTRLIGGEEQWTKWSSSQNKEFTNLSHGNYIFEVKAKNSKGELSGISSYSFTIDRPWYHSFLAYLIYFSSFIGMLLALTLIPRKKYKENTAILVEEKKKSDAEVEIMKQEKLENEIKFKNRELASSTLHLLQKNQTLSNIREKLEAIQKQIDDKSLKSEFKQLIYMLNSDMRLEDDWDKFSFHFDQVHQNFINKLKSKYPQLSTNDHKLCAYLKMNLSTKEIAPLLNISVRGVEIGRYRLRKKLNLDRSVNLNEFFNNELVETA